MATNPKAYADLRTMLDSLEMGVLRYYLNGQGLSQPQKFKYLQEKLMPLIDELWHQSQAKSSALADCPDGYYDCAGCCVPYKCPDISNGLTKPRAGSKRKR